MLTRLESTKAVVGKNGIEKTHVNAVLHDSTVQENGYRMTMRHQAVTPALASFWLENYDYEGQRNLRESNLRLLSNEMLGNRFLPNSMLIFWAENNELKLIDGRHRLNSLVRTGKTEYFWIQTICSDSSSVGVLYSVIDVGSPRSSKDALKALQTQVPQLWLGQTSIIGGIRRIKEGFGFFREKPTGIELDEMIVEWADALNLYGESIKGGSITKHLRSSRMIAAGLITCRWQPVIAQQFWNGIAYDDGLKQDDPRKYIVKSLLDDNHPLQHLGARYEKTSGQILAYVWNKFVKGSSMVKIRGMVAESPIVFDGTPYNTSLANNGYSIDTH